MLPWQSPCLYSLCMEQKQTRWPQVLGQDGGSRSLFVLSEGLDPKLGSQGGSSGGTAASPRPPTFTVTPCLPSAMPEGIRAWFGRSLEAELWGKQVKEALMSEQWGTEWYPWGGVRNSSIPAASLPTSHPNGAQLSVHRLHHYGQANPSRPELHCLQSTLNPFYTTSEPPLCCRSHRSSAYPYLRRHQARS